MKKSAKREVRVNFPSAWQPAGVSDAFYVGLAARRCFWRTPDVASQPTTY
jgi:hypothetical protein